MKRLSLKPDGPGRQFATVIAILAIAALGSYLYFSRYHVPAVDEGLTSRPRPAIRKDNGKVLQTVAVKTFTPAEATGVIRQNYGLEAPATATKITKVIFQYRSEGLSGQPIALYGRAYIPDLADQQATFAFAPGTTGIGDQCAASLEEPTKSNWANYDSHLLMYASKGYTAVTTDYEGMRDPERLHHYMIGELEGRALLDSVRALKRLPEAKSAARNNVFLSGYSQGGHAAFWADKVADSYATELIIKGVVGFGPVMSVERTLADITRGANINWFGPFVLTSYSDFYATNYNLERIFLPHWQSRLKTEVPAHCIDTVIPHWGRDPAKIYQPEFLAALSGGKLSENYRNLWEALQRNAVGPSTTRTAKLINQGARDNVVLPGQQEAVLPELCRSSRGPVVYRPYPAANHYDTMRYSLNDTLAWMQQVSSGKLPATTCK